MNEAGYNLGFHHGNLMRDVMLGISLIPLKNHGYEQLSRTLKDYTDDIMTNVGVVAVPVANSVAASELCLASQADCRHQLSMVMHATQGRRLHANRSMENASHSLIVHRPHLTTVTASSDELDGRRYPSDDNNIKVWCHSTL